MLALQGVTTALALQEGLSSPIFAVSVAFSVIVMYDAMGVRQHAGKQAAVLNQVGAWAVGACGCGAGCPALANSHTSAFCRTDCAKA